MMNTQNTIEAADIMDRILANFDALDESPPEAEKTAEQPKRHTSALSSRHGWPERVIRADGEPEGTEWHASFDKAAPVIERGGIAVFHGLRGTGKTRMAGELARTIAFPFDYRRHGTPIGSPIEKTRTAAYRTAMGFFTEIRSTYAKNSEATEKQVVEALEAYGLLVIDELQERGATAFEDRLLTHLIDKRYGAMLPTILISNQTKDQLFESISPSIADRIAETGIRIEFNWKSFRR
jgi:DNA replication protein DnaC